MRIGSEYNGNFDGGSGGGEYESPEADIYDAVIAAIEPVGLQPSKDAAKAPYPACIVALELVQTADGTKVLDSKGRRFVVWKDMAINLFDGKNGKAKAANFRLMLDAVKPGRVAEMLAAGGEADSSEWEGQMVRVVVEHTANGKAKAKSFMRSKVAPGTYKAERTYDEPWGLWKYLLGNKVG